MELKRGFSCPNFAAGGESEYDVAFRKAIAVHCPNQAHHGGCHYPDCPQSCEGRQRAAEALSAHLK